MDDQELFKKLDLEPEFRLPAYFPEKIRLIAQKKEDRRKAIRFYISSLIAIFITFSVGYGLIRLMSFDAAELFLSVLFGYKWILMTIVICFLCILYGDQTLIKKQW